MKKRFGIWRRLLIIFGTIVLLAGIYAVVIVISAGNAQSSVEKTKEELRKQGFKTDLAEFDFSVPANELGFANCVERMASPRTALPQRFLPVSLMRRAGPDSAIVTWKEDSVVAENEVFTWTNFVDTAQLNDPEFLEARAAAFSEPIRFNLNAKEGMALRLPQLAMIRRISQDCGSAMIVDLHNHDRAAAWTNLVAITRLVTAWEPEPTDVSPMVRFALVSMTSQATWEAMQAGDWSEAQLATLQRDWESLDFFKNLPETLAFKRAGALAECEQRRKEAMESFRLWDDIKEMAQSPGQSPQMARMLWEQLRYLYGSGVYEDERALLLFYRDREAELRNALKATSWQAMKSMPGITNQPMFASKYRFSVVTTLLNLRQLNMAFVGRGTGFLGRAAEAESYRRLLVTALALERFRVKHAHYPAGLDELAPEFLKQPPIDFMDGRPLRYRLGVDGRFVLYSTGLDGVDDGGMIAKPMNPTRADFAVVPGMQEAGDIVWPRAATSNEVAILREQESQERQREAELKQRMDSEEYWNRTAARQGRADSSFVTPEAEINANSLNGRRVSDILRNENLAGTNTLTEMLTLHQVVTGAEPETITFEAPIKLDAVTNVGGLNLLIDLNKGDVLEEAEGTVAQIEISRATNGNCLLAWHTIFETPGRHTLQMGLFMEDGNWRKVVAGPTAVMEVTNLCQFSESSAHFDSAMGAWLFAKVPELKADYSVDIFSTDGKRVKTISGNTSNGVIEVFWDLLGEDKQKLVDQSFSTVFRITLSESGQTQRLKGP